MVELLLALLAGDRDLLGVHDDYEVTRVDMGRVRWLALAAQRVGDLGCEPAEGLSLGVDEQPVPLPVLRGCDVSLQGGRHDSQGSLDRRLGEVARPWARLLTHMESHVVTSLAPKRRALVTGGAGLHRVAPLVDALAGRRIRGLRVVDNLSTGSAQATSRASAMQARGSTFQQVVLSRRRDQGHWSPRSPPSATSYSTWPRRSTCACSVAEPVCDAAGQRRLAPLPCWRPRGRRPRASCSPRPRAIYGDPAGPADARRPRSHPCRPMAAASTPPRCTWRRSAACTASRQSRCAWPTSTARARTRTARPA